MNKIKIFVIFVLLSFTINISAETYYQNTKPYPIDVPTDTGSTVQIPSGKFVGGTYYQALADIKFLTLWTGIPATPSPTDIVYVYNSTKALDNLLPDQTSANGKFLKSVLGKAIWENVPIIENMLLGTLTTGQIPYATAQHTLSSKNTLTFDEATNSFSTSNINSNLYNTTAPPVPAAPTATAVVPAQALITVMQPQYFVDGETLTIYDGTDSIVYEFDNNGSVLEGHTQFDLTLVNTIGEVRNALLELINMSGLDLLATIFTADTISVALNVGSVVPTANAETVANPSFIAGTWTTSSPLPFAPCTYRVVISFLDGSQSAASAPTSILCPETMDVYHRVELSTTPVLGASLYSWYRTVSPVFPGSTGRLTGIDSETPTATDAGEAGDDTAAPETGTYGGIYLGRGIHISSIEDSDGRTTTFTSGVAGVQAEVSDTAGGLASMYLDTSGGVASINIQAENEVDSASLGVSTEGVYISGSFSVEKIKIYGTLPIYEDNAAAIAGGLATGEVYRTASGVLMVVYATME